jgi:hypothetical protein
MPRAVAVAADAFIEQPTSVRSKAHPEQERVISLEERGYET